MDRSDNEEAVQQEAAVPITRSSRQGMGGASQEEAAFGHMREEVLAMKPDSQELRTWWSSISAWKRCAFWHHNPDLIPLFRQKLGSHHSWIPDPLPPAAPAAGPDHVGVL